MRKLCLTAWICFVALAAGCNGETVLTPGKDFTVLAKTQSGDMTVYLSEVGRMGKQVYLVFRFRQPEKIITKTSIICAEITGGIDSTFEKIEKDGWVELRCKTDYPVEAKELGFVLRMCEEPSCEGADIELAARVPDEGGEVSPNLSGHLGETKFRVEKVVYLASDPWPVTDGDPKMAKGRAVRYGEKHVLVNPGEEHALVVVSRAKFGGELPVLPRGYSEWDQVIVTDRFGKDMGGGVSTSDVGDSRYYAHVWVGREAAPDEIRVCFFSAETLAGFRREFVFSGLKNPLE